MNSHDPILPLNWSTSSPFGGRRRKSSPATVAVDHWATPGSLSIPTSRRSAGALTVESHSYVYLSSILFFFFGPRGIPATWKTFSFFSLPTTWTHISDKCDHNTGPRTAPENPRGIALDNIPIGAHRRLC